MIRQRSWRSLYFYPSVSTAPRFAGTRMRSHGAGGAKGRGVASDTEKPPGRLGTRRKRARSSLPQGDNGIDW